MAENEFSSSEVVWAKIRGYPWWPAEVKSIIPDSKETKFLVYFIGDNTHATLPQSKLSNFQKSFKEFSKSKKNKLLESIKKAKDVIDSRQKDTKDTNYRSKITENDKDRGNDNTTTNSRDKILSKKETNQNASNASNGSNGSNSSNGSNIKDLNNLNNLNNYQLLRKKTKRIKSKKIITNSPSMYRHKTTNIDRKNRNRLDSDSKTRESKGNGDLPDIIINISHYLLYIVKNFESIDLNNEKEILIKILNYLKDNKMENPVQFLQSTAIGKMLIFLDKNCKDSEILTYIRDTHSSLTQRTMDSLL